MNNYLIDNHLHMDLTFDIETILEQANKNNVLKLVVSGCDKTGIMDGIDIVKRYDNIYLTVGYHPDEVDKITDDDLMKLEELIINNKKIVGIGEIGLDYYHNDTNILRQKEFFRKQIELAIKHKLPVVIHGRDSIQDIYDILSEYDVSGIIHCFSGSLEMANLFIKKGFYLGIGGVITFKNSKLKDVVKEISLSNIVLETDSPYLSPEPYRGRENSSKNIKIIAQKIAEIKGTTLNEVMEITTKNSNELFDFIPQK